MYKAGLAACIIILLVCTSGCSFLSTTPKPALKQAGSEKSLLEIPELPDQYTARSPQPLSQNYVQPAPIRTRGEKPVLESAAQTKIAGSVLSDNSTEDQLINATIAIITQPNWQDAQSRIVVSAVDSANPVTSRFASQWLRHGSSANLENFFDMFNSVMDWSNTSQLKYSLKDNWTYVEDPTLYGQADYWAPASTTIQNRDPATGNLRGDCDDFAILNSAMVNSIGGASRLAYALGPSTNGSFCVGHLYMEAYHANLSFVPAIKNRYGVTDVGGFHEGNPGYWIALDWFPDPAGFQHPGASLYDNSRGLTYFYADGTWTEIMPLDPSCTGAQNRG